MKLSVDRKLCRGHGRCYALCPEFFDEDEEGYAVIESSDVPPELEAKVRQAADNCPELAIRIAAS
jgi:ferredoxin